MWVCCSLSGVNVVKARDKINYGLDGMRCALQLSGEEIGMARMNVIWG